MVISLPQPLIYKHYSTFIDLKRLLTFDIIRCSYSSEIHGVEIRHEDLTALIGESLHSRILYRTVKRLRALVCINNQNRLFYETQRTQRHESKPEAGFRPPECLDLYIFLHLVYIYIYIYKHPLMLTDDLSIDSLKDLIHLIYFKIWEVKS